MKSKRLIPALPMFLLAVSLVPLQSTVVRAEENGLLSLKFLKQQPSLLNQNTTSSPAATQEQQAKLPMVQSPAYASNGLTRMTANDMPRRLQNTSGPVQMQQIPESSDFSPENGIQLSMRSDDAGNAPTDRTPYGTFNINMPPVEKPNHNIVGVSGLVPLDSGKTPDSRLQPLQRLSDTKIDKADLPTFTAINRTEPDEEYKAISHPVADSSRSDSYSLTSAVEDQSSTRASASITPDSRLSGVHLHELDASEMKSAMFNGIQPGVTTKKEMLEIMGQPTSVTPLNAATFGVPSVNTDGEVIVFSLEELGVIEATVQQGTVFSLVWILPEPYPSEQIRKEGLESELRGIRSIHIPDADGYILGQMFPEKGVVFSFIRSETPGEASLMVNLISIEPITSWPFELRGERYLTIANSKAKWDLTIAVQLDPNNHRARWLLAQAFLADGQLAEAQRECNFAIKLQSDQPQYNVTLAEIIGKAGYTKEARQYLEYLIPHCESLPHLKGRAMCLLGDFYREELDLMSAKKYHQVAIDTVTPHLGSTNTTIRQQCKLVHMNTFLSMALDISLSDWGNKAEMLPQWLDGAESLALDLVIKEKMSQENLLNVALAAINSHVNFPELEGLDKWVKLLESVSDEIIMKDNDPATVRRIETQMAVALYDIEQLCEYHRDYKTAQQYGKKAVGFFEQYLDENDDVINLYRLANLYYQLGRLDATGAIDRKTTTSDKADHMRAVAWFAKSIPLFQLIEASLDENEKPFLGKMYADIGFSYWAIAEREYAVQITEYGIGKLEEAVDAELVTEDVLAIPYENLSSMYKAMGRLEEAENYYIRSKQAKSNIASGTSSVKSVK